MSKIKTLLAIVALLLCGGAWAAAGDAVISFNVTKGDTGNVITESHGAQDTLAGKIPLAAWTQGTGVSGSGVALNQYVTGEDGTQTVQTSTATISWGIPSNPTDLLTGSGHDDALFYFRSYLCRGNSASADVNLSVSNIPYDNYKVYIYFAGNGSIFNSFTYNDTAYTVNEFGVPVEGSTQWGSVNKTGLCLGQNVVCFENQTSTSITISSTITNCGIAAIQIVKAAAVADESLKYCSTTAGALLANSYVDTGWTVTDISELLDYSISGIMSGGYVGGTVGAKDAHYRPAKAYNARKVGDSVYVEYQTYDNQTKVVLVEFKLMTAQGADHATVHAKAVGIAFTTANAVGALYMIVAEDGTITRINGSTNVSGGATIPLATTNTGNGYGVRSIVATPVNKNPTIKNTDQGTGDEGAGNWNLGDFKIAADTFGFPEGTLLKVKSISLAARSGNTPSDKIRINGILSESKTTPNGTTTGWEGTAGYEANYTFDNGLIVVVGTTYTINATDANGSVVNSQLCSRPGFNSDDYKIIKYASYNHWALCVIDAEGISPSTSNVIRVDNGNADGTALHGNNAYLVNSGTSTVDFGSFTQVNALNISGSGDLTIKNAQNLKFSSFNASGLTGLTMEYDCTAASMTADDQLKNFIKQANGSCKFIFKGAGANGATMDFGTVTASFSSHIVFTGGTHSWTSKNDDASRKFGQNATQDNPTIRVTGGATVTMNMKDPCGWNASVNTEGILRVDDGSTLNICTIGSSTLFWNQQIYIEPGATCKMTDSNSTWKLRPNGGADKTKCQIYVPDCDVDNGKVARLIQGGSSGIQQSNSGNSIGIYVGRNAKLECGIVFNDDSRNVVKYGEGALVVTKACNAPFVAEEGYIGKSTTGSYKKLTIKSTASIAFPTGHAADTAFTLCTGDFIATAPAEATDILVGNKLYKGATLTYDTAAKTVKYTLPAAKTTYALTEDEKSAAEALSYGGVMIIKGSSNYAANATITNLPDGCKAYANGGSEIKVIKIYNDAAIESKIAAAALHFDASVLNSITADAVGNVASWKNLGSDGTRTHATLTGNGRTNNVSPIYEVGGEFPYVDLGECNSQKDLGWTRLSGIKAVIQVVAIKNDKRTFFMGDYNGGTNGSGDGRAYCFHSDQSANGSVKYFNNNATVTQVYDNGVDKGNGQSQVRPEDFRVITAEISGTCGNADCFAMDRNNGDNRSGGHKICETIVFTTALSADDRVKIEDYLMRKWFQAVAVYNGTPYTTVAAAIEAATDANLADIKVLDAAAIPADYCLNNGQIVKAAAKIGATGYPTVAAAITAAQANDEIEILANSSETLTLDRDVIFTVAAGKEFSLSGVMSSDYNVTKKGAGTLSIKHNVDAGKTLEVAEGTLKLTTPSNYSMKGHLIVRADATLVNMTTDAFGIDNDNVRADIYGTLNMNGTRWTLGRNNHTNDIYFYPGSAIVGLGQQQYGALDNGQSGKTNLHFVKNCGVGGTVTFDTEIRFRNDNGKSAGMEIEEGVTVNYINTVGFRSNSGTLYVTGGGVFNIAAGASLTNLTTLDVGGGASVSGANAVSCGLRYSNGGVIDATGTLLSVGGSLTFTGSPVVKLAAGETIGNKQILTLADGGSCTISDDAPVYVEVFVGGVRNLDHFYKLAVDGSAVKVVEVEPITVEQEIANSASLGAMTAAGGTLKFSGVGGVQGTALSVPELCKVELDPIRTPVKVNGNVMINGKIKLSSAWDSTTVGKFTLLTYSGTLTTSAANLKDIVEVSGGREYAVAEVESTENAGCRQLILKIGDYDNQAKPIKVMPLGDSITEGTNALGFGRPNYRTQLMAKLEASGYKATSCGYQRSDDGCKKNSAGVFAPIEHQWHCGMSGQECETLSTAGWEDSIDVALDAAGYPDIITFKIGTNDMKDGAYNGKTVDEVANGVYRAWTNVLWKIRRARPNTKIVVGTVLTPDTKTALARTLAFNAKITDFVTRSKANEAGYFPADYIYLADLYTACPRPNPEDAETIPFGDNFKDWLHPNWVGHNLTSDKWLEVIKTAAANEVAKVAETVTPNTKKGAEANVDRSYRANMVKIATITPSATWKLTNDNVAEAMTLEPGITTSTKFYRVGYYMELQRKDQAGTESYNDNVRYVWADMDAFGDATLATMGFPTGDNQQCVVHNLHVDSNDTGIRKVLPTDEAAEGFVEFTKFSYGTDASGVAGAPAQEFSYDWNDTLGMTGSYGCMQVHRIFKGGESWNAGEVLMAYNRWTTSDSNEIGIGSLAQKMSSTSMDYTFVYNLEKFSTTAYKHMAIEIWGELDDGVVATIGETPYQTIQAAIDDADEDDEIVINPKASLSAEALSITKDVTIVTEKTFSMTGAMSGTGTLTKKGAGELTMAATTSFEGSLVVSEGKVIAGAAYAFGKNGTSITVEDGATVDVNNCAGIYNFTISGDGVDRTGALVNNSGSGLNFNNAGCLSLTLAADASVGGSHWWGMNNVASASLALNEHTLTIRTRDVSNAAYGFVTGNSFATAAAGKVVVADGATLWIYRDFNASLTEATLEIMEGSRVNIEGSGKTLTVKNVILHDGVTFNGGTLVVNGDAAGTGSVPKLTFGEGATVSGQVTVSGTLAVSGTVTLTAADATLTVPAELDAGKVLSGVANTTVSYDEATRTYVVYTPVSHTYTPVASGDFSWANGTVIGEKTYRNTDNMSFATTEYTTAVTVPAKITAGTFEVGGIYSFSGLPIVATSLGTLEGSNASFANDVIADTVTVNHGTVKGESFVASSVSVANATFGAKVVGPSMRYVRLSITATQGSGEKPAVGEFRLYRGNATTGYTIVDWPVGTVVRESTGLVATKENEGYPCEVGAGLGNQGGNECQPGCLIDGYYGNATTPSIYGGGTYRNPHYNKWWPTSQASGPWTVTIEFPYPVAMFSGCNFCLADHGPRNPTAWTIEVSNDGTNWTEVNNTTDATWSGQYAWAGGNENVPAFLNTGTTPTTVSVGEGATILADGNWTAALNVSGHVTVKGVAEKYLTLDAASTSSFAEGATLTFDLSDYSVTRAGNQYVVAGPLTGWPNTDAITVVPEGLFTVGKDEFGYYATARNGTYWLGDAEGVGSWNVANAAVWAESAESDTGLIWLNGAAANFSRNGDVTVAEGVEVSGIALSEGVAVSLSGTLPTIGADGIAIAANATLTIGELTDAATTLTAAISGAGNVVFDIGAGKVLTLSGNNINLTGNVMVKSGTLKLGSSNCLGQKNNSSRTILVKNGAILDMGGQGSGSDPAYTLTLEEGAKYTSSVVAGGDSKWAFLPSGIVLNGDATIEAGDYRVGLSRGYNYATTVNLGTHTLAKTGSGEAYFSRPTISGTGKFLIAEGSVRMACDAYNSSPTLNDGTLEIRSGAHLVFDNYQNGVNFAVKNAVINGSVGGAGRLTVNSTLSGSGTIEKLTLANGATVSGSIVVSVEAAIANSGTVTLADNSTLTVPEELPEGAVTTDVLGMKAAPVVNPDGSVTYSLALKPIDGVTVREDSATLQPVVSITGGPANTEITVTVGGNTFVGTTSAEGAVEIPLWSETVKQEVDKGYTYTVSAGGEQLGEGAFFTGNIYAAAYGSSGVTVNGSWGVTNVPTRDEEAGEYVLNNAEAGHTFTITDSTSTANKPVTVAETITFASAIDELPTAGEGVLAGAKGALTLATEEETLCWKGLVGGAWATLTGVDAAEGTCVVKVETTADGKKMRYLVGAVALTTPRGEGAAGTSAVTDEQGWFTVTGKPTVMSFVGTGRLAKLEAMVGAEQDPTVVVEGYAGENGGNALLPLKVDSTFATGLGGTKAEIQKKLNETPAVDGALKVWQAYALGATATLAQAGVVPVVRGEQTTSAATLKLVDGLTINAAAGVTVTRKVKTAPTPAGLDGATATDPVSSDAEGVTITLPTGVDKVKYFKLEYSFE